MATMSPIFDDDFQNLCDTLEGLLDPAKADPRFLDQELDDRLEELKKLLDVPPKNDVARNKLKSGKLEIDGMEYQLNEQFQQEAAQISDNFNLDETLASKLLLKGGQQAEQLDRTPIQGAKFLYHNRRKNLLDAIRLILSYITEDRGDSEARRLLTGFAEKLLSSDSATSFTDRCISAMAAVRDAVQQLRDKERHAQTLGMALDPGLREDLELQMRFLRNQHELLASIVFYLVRYRRGSVADFKKLLGVLKGLDRYDSFMAHHLLPLFGFIATLCGTESPISFQETIKLHKEVLKDYKESVWVLRPVQAAVMVWWLSEFNGLCNDLPPPDAPSQQQLDYMADVYGPIKSAIKDGGLEYIMALSADVSIPAPLNSAKEEMFRFLQTRVFPLEDVAVLLYDFKAAILSQLELFIDSFISNMADLLKEIKTREEEDVLLGQKTFDFELERFFLAIHFTYYGRTDAASTFWSDPQSNLHGFLTWASLRQTPMMTATFCYMVASLAMGTECADAAHKFLLDEVTPGSTKNRRSQYISWEYIFSQFQSYITQLNKQRQPLLPSSGYKPPPGPPEPVGPDPGASMMLDGFMRLIGQIAADSSTARNWLMDDNQNFHLLPALFDLLHKDVAIQLWDSIFSTITALLSEKPAGLGATVWNMLDAWSLGPQQPPQGSLQVGGSTALVKSTFGQSGSDRFDMIVNTVHPAEAFTRLLSRLVEPPLEVAELKDALPFPENLGSSNRISGMEPYTDFILESIFSHTTIKNLPQDLPVTPDKQESATERVSRSQYKKFRPALQLACLQFIHTSLASFNDDLLTMAHKNIAVDGGIRTSSLSTYTKLHPFGRVMEHILTEKCLNVFFEILQLGTELLLSYIEPPQPVVETVLLTIMVLDLAIQMQPTYFRVVRPYIKQNEGARRTTITGNSFDGLEKAVHYHLQTIVHLGLFVGASQPEVSLAAISLLEKFNISPDLVASTENGLLPSSAKNRVLSVVEQSPESRRIVFNFIHQWERDNDLGETGRFPLKMPVLRFLESTLAAQPNEYTLAHMILGFGFDPKDGISMSTQAGGIGSGVSLLHCILDVAQEAPEQDNQGFIRPLCELKNSCFSILAHLWKASSTSSEVLFVLRANKFFFSGFLQERAVATSTLWDGVMCEASMAFFRAGGYSYCNFLQRRTALFEYTALEIRQLTLQGASTMVQKYLTTLMGETTTPDGATLSNVHILDLLDFLEFKLPESLQAPRVTYFNDCNLGAFEENNSFRVPLFDFDIIAEYLEIKKNELLNNGKVNSDQLGALESERKAILQHLFGENQLRLCRSARLGCLKAWTTLIMVMLEDCDMEGTTKAMFVLQALQAILPKLEAYSTEDIESAQELSTLAHSLISHIDFDTTVVGAGRGSDLANDRLYQLFRVALRCIQSPLATSKLREDFYNIALRYLTGMAVNGRSTDVKRHSTQTIKASGDRLLEVLCNDAYSGDGECKVVSLLLLEALAAMAADDGSSYVVDTLVRQNFLVVLIDSIKGIGWDLTQSNDVVTVMKAFKAATGFLLRIAQTRPGAGQVLDAGLFQALRECELFSVDPDLGINFKDPQALSKYYDLLLDIMRVVATCIMSRGPQNRVALDSARLFLMDHRNIAISVFKKYLGIGGAADRAIGNLKELTEVFVLLYSLVEGGEEVLHA